MRRFRSLLTAILGLLIVIDAIMGYRLWESGWPKQIGLTSPEVGVEQVQVIADEPFSAATRSGDEARGTADQDGGVQGHRKRHAALEEAATRAGMTLSDWCREALTTAAQTTAGTPSEEAVLAEVIALRTVLLNLMFSLAKGEAVTAAGMQNLIERADANKLERARARLSEARNGQGQGTAASL